MLVWKQLNHVQWLSKSLTPEKHEEKGRNPSRMERMNNFPTIQLQRRIQAT